jgi:hypothetical protein
MNPNLIQQQLFGLWRNGQSIHLMISTPDQQCISSFPTANLAWRLSFGVSKSLLHFVSWMFKLGFVVRGKN